MRQPPPHAVSDAMREIGSIDEHQHIGRRGHDRIDGLAHAPQQQRQLGNHGPETDRG
jgi:hypothetical protein